MENYYVVVETRTHAFLLENRLNNSGVMCEICYIPRQLMTELCNLGVRFSGSYLNSAIYVIKYSGLPGCRVFKETVLQEDYEYSELSLF